MIDTFKWPTQVSPIATDTINLYTAQFGDGYQQVAVNGINNIAEQWDLTWTGKKKDVAAIRTFLHSHAHQSFWWSNPWGEKKLYRVNLTQSNRPSFQGKSSLSAFLQTGLCAVIVKTFNQPLMRLFLLKNFMGLNADFQALEPGEKIQLIEVDGTPFGMDKVLRFHAYSIHSEGWISFAADNLPSIIWQGKEYDPHPYEVTGLELSGSGPQPTPTLSVGNISNNVTALCLQYDDMVKAKVRIHTTFAKYLDAANWVHGNLTAEPDTVFVICTVPVVAQINFCQCGQRGIVDSLIIVLCTDKRERNFIPEILPFRLRVILSINRKHPAAILCF